MPSRKPNKEEELFVDNLNYFLECMGYQDKELCSLLHVNAATISSYLNKKRRIPDEHRKTISDLMKLSEQFLSNYDLRGNRRFDFKEYLSLSDIDAKSAFNNIDKAFSDEFSYYDAIYSSEEQEEFLKPVKRLVHFLNTYLDDSTYSDEKFAERIAQYSEEILKDYGDENVETDEKFLSELIYLLGICQSLQVKEKREDAFIRYSFRSFNTTRWVVADLISHKRHSEIASFSIWLFYSAGYFGPLLSADERKPVVNEYFGWLLFTNNKYASAAINDSMNKMQEYVYSVFLAPSPAEA